MSDELMELIEEQLKIDDELLEKVTAFYHASEEPLESDSIEVLENPIAFHSERRSAYRKLWAYQGVNVDEEKVKKLLAIRKKRKRLHLDYLNESTFGTILNGVALSTNELVRYLERQTISSAPVAEYKAVPYTIEINWKEEVVQLNQPVSKERLILTERDSVSIQDAFKLIEGKCKGLF